MRRCGDAVASAVAVDVRAGAVPTVVSGDCLVALATIAGPQRAGIDPAVPPACPWHPARDDPVVTIRARLLAALVETLVMAQATNWKI